jgi:hypothetical protein
MKTKTDAVKILIEAGWAIDEVNLVLRSEHEKEFTVSPQWDRIVNSSPIQIDTKTIPLPNQPMEIWY